MKLIQLFFVSVLFFAFNCSGPGADMGADSGTIPASNVQEKPAQSVTSEVGEKAAALPQGTISPLISETILKEASAEKEQSKTDRKKKREREKKAKSIAGIEFKETIYDFGVITQGDKIRHDFVFENTGKKNLEILKVDVTCGCTTPTFPFIPIAPGEKGTIGVMYDSTGKLGSQKPMITIVSNAKPHTVKIYLKGVVDAVRTQDKKETTDSKENY
ncbi:MAG: hypothetical protein ACI8VT_003541 [Saprospiraceae bacterium]|jgi:hypothetical protein